MIDPQCEIIMEEQQEISDNQSNDDQSSTSLLRQTIIDHIIMKGIDSDFKSQQKDEPDLSFDEKRKITEKVLDDSHSKFLYLFGKYLLESHLEYFKSENDNYEINFHLRRLNRSINSKKVISKNRRYQALLELVKGDYFSDNEMRNREPLLWEQLVGQYLSQEEKLNYDIQNSAQNSLTAVLLEQIDCDNRDDLKRRQEIEEVHKPNDDDYNSSDEQFMTVEVNNPSSLWGEYSKPKVKTAKIGKRRWREDHSINQELCNTKELSNNERLLLLNEFRSHMFHKFLSGQDKDFDYESVDNNPEYDNLHIKGIDEEEKYFDSESPIITADSPQKTEDESEEDELDIYMNMLEKNEITDSVSDKFKHL